MKNSLLIYIKYFIHKYAALESRTVQSTTTTYQTYMSALGGLLNTKMPANSRPSWY